MEEHIGSGIGIGIPRVCLKFMTCLVHMPHNVACILALAVAVVRHGVAAASILQLPLFAAFRVGVGDGVSVVTASITLLMLLLLLFLNEKHRTNMQTQAGLYVEVAGRNCKAWGILVRNIKCIIFDKLIRVCLNFLNLY